MELQVFIHTDCKVYQVFLAQSTRLQVSKSLSGLVLGVVISDNSLAL